MPGEIIRPSLDLSIAIAPCRRLTDNGVITGAGARVIRYRCALDHGYVNA